MNNRVDSVIKKYRLAELTFVEAEVNGKKLGYGKIMSDACFETFCALDPSGDHKYLDWMLYMAGGGQSVMDKSLRLWKGEVPEDPNSLRNLCHKDFITEQVGGYADESGLYHAPVEQDAAEEAWKKNEARFFFEFIMGDQDIASEDGFGFYREWPGQDRRYERIASVIRLWHDAQPKLLAQNRAALRAAKLRASAASTRHSASSTWTDEDRAFMIKFDESPTELVELDLYAKWSPKEYSQNSATYNTLQAVLDRLSDIRRAQLLKDDRYDLIYEDEIVRAICPLTVGASIKHGSSKWCVSNRSEFDRSLENGYGAGPGHTWRSYTQKGPLVFLLFKVPMPAWTSRLAIHMSGSDLKYLAERIYTLNWFDVKNEPGTSYQHSHIVQRIRNEHLASYSSLQCNDKALALAGRESGAAWTRAGDANPVLRSLEQAVFRVIAWGMQFDHRKVVVDYLTDFGAPVIK